MTGDRPVVTRRRLAGATHEVVSIDGPARGHRRSPCDGCPWRRDQVGVFPAEAFEHSAETAYDMADRTFACHEAGYDTPLTCAGFLLRGAGHNLAVRMGARPGGRYEHLDQVHDGGHQLHDSYRAMAEANGVDPDHPRLARCRGSEHR